MKIPELHLNTTAFLCVDEMGIGGTRPVPKATAFFVQDRSGEPPYPIWVVTARHCIDEARASGQQAYLRVNTLESYVDIPTSPDNWHFAHDADVALAYWLGPVECVITAVPIDQFVDADYRYRGSADLPVADKMREAGGQSVDVGHEVFFVGLFSQHAGRKRNLPIARTGSVARRPIEPVTVQRSDGSTEELEAYLVEARSWGGHSGSPVFWYYPIAEVTFVPDPTPLPANPKVRRAMGIPEHRPQIPISREGGLLALLGLVTAHFDIPQEARPRGDDFSTFEMRLNSGIAVVSPAHKIRELIETEAVQEERRKYRSMEQAQPAATYDTVGFPPRVD